MLSLVLTLSAFAASAASASFDSWRAATNTVYATAEEEAYRRTVYHGNEKEVARMTALSPGAVFSIEAAGARADLTSTEFRARATGYTGVQNPTTFAATASATTAAAAAAAAASFERLAVPQIDWREHGAVDPTVFDQGECGCCWSISVAQTVGSQYFLHANTTSKMSAAPSVSFQQMICCDYGNVDAGCHGGDPHTAYSYILRAGGLESEANYPFTDSGPNAQSCNLQGKSRVCVWGVYVRERERERAATSEERSFVSFRPDIDLLPW